MRDLKTLLCLIVCTMAQRGETTAATISDNERGNLKLYKDYCDAFYNNARNFMNAQTPKMDLLAKIQNDAENFAELTKDMVEFTDNTVKSAAAQIKSFPITFLREARELTEASVDTTVIWKKTALNDRRALNARLLDTCEELGRILKTTTEQDNNERNQDNNERNQDNNERNQDNNERNQDNNERNQAARLEQEKKNLKVYKDYWEAFYRKAIGFLLAESPNMMLLREINEDAKNFRRRTEDMVEFSDPALKYTIARIKSFPRGLVLHVLEGKLTTTSDDNTVKWTNTHVASKNRRSLIGTLTSVNRQHEEKFTTWSLESLPDTCPLSVYSRLHVDDTKMNRPNSIGCNY